MSDASELINQQFKEGGVIPAQLNGQNVVSKTYVDQIIEIAKAELAAIVNAKKSFSTIGGVSAISASDTLTLYTGTALGIVADPTNRTLTFNLDQSKLMQIPAQNITYSGSVTGASQVKQAIDTLKQTVDSITSGGDSGPEVSAARVSTPYGITYTNLKDRLDAADQRQRYEVISVMDYGAKGDGTTDDYQAFVNAIAAAGDKDRLYIPKPANFYRISQKIVINKPLFLEGNHYEVKSPVTPTLIFDSSVITGIEITSRDVHLKGISLKMNSVSNTLIAGIYLNNDTLGALSNIMLEDIFVYLSHIYGAGIKGKNVITSIMENVRCYQGSYGFYFDTAGTSIKFDTCWGMANTKTGYYVASYEYCDFINCACDSPNKPDYAYHMNSCNGISFVGCGAEGMGKTMFRFQGGIGISVISGRAVAMNQATTATATFAELTDEARSVSFVGCRDDITTLPSIIVTGSRFPAALNCYFGKFSINGTLSSETFTDRGSLRLGLWGFYESPFSGMISIVSGRELAMNALKIGVLKPDISGYAGYIDADGSIVAATVGTLPTASVANRGKILRVEGGTGVADRIYICRKNASNAYEWAVLD